jgi:hypothetical protein
MMQRRLVGRDVTADRSLPEARRLLLLKLNAAARLPGLREGDGRT